MRRTAERLRGPLRAAGGALGALHAINRSKGAFTRVARSMHNPCPTVTYADSCYSAQVSHQGLFLSYNSCRCWDSCSGRRRMRG